MIRTLIFYAFLLVVARGEFFKTQIGDLKTSEEGAELFGGSFGDDGFFSRITIARFAQFAFVVPGFEEVSRDDEDQIIKDGWLILEFKTSASRKGFLDIWNLEENKWVVVACEVDAVRLKECTAEEVQKAREWHAGHQLQIGSKGGLWYRSFVKKDRGNNWRDRDFDDTFTTLSGGRALAENLALDRDLILGHGEETEEVALETIKGVTVAPIAWKEWMPEGEITVDEISKRVPEDQYFMTVSSLKDLFRLMDRIEGAGMPVLQSFSIGDDYRELPARYRRQMGLDLPDALAGFLPVKNVAVTGGDPFFPTGSDVAVVMETEKVDFVYATLKSALTAKAKLAGATAVGDGFQNKARSFSSFLAKLDGAVVISNSQTQIARLRGVAEGKIHGLGVTDEYRFFRHRYAVDAEESAYVFISDACLRRWSGPEVRITASRRSRALSALAAVTSRHLEKGIVDQEFEPLLGKVEFSENQIVSSKYGSLNFLTPISELDVTTVSQMEKEAYVRWRQGYENGWARFFDPIAIRLNLKKEREEMGLSILPLRVDSEYQQFIALAGEAVLSEASQMVPAEALMHMAMAIDKESEVFKSAGVSLLDFMPSLSVNPLGWMGDAVSITFGESLAWRGQISESMFKDLPLLVRVDVESRLKLALFITALKATIESGSPDLVSWETRKHGDRKYVAMIGDPDDIDIALYYAALPSGLLISFNEEMLKRAIDREQKVKKGKKGKGQFMAQATPEFLGNLNQFGQSQSLEERRRVMSYSALPILNEWYKSQEQKDPVAFDHERFGSQISCPGGLGYQWNKDDLTMESLAFGHPGRARSAAKSFALFERFKTIEMSGAFEKGGMEMTMALDEKSKFVSPKITGKPRPTEDGEVILFQDLYPQIPGMILKYETEEHYDDDEPEITQSLTRINRVTKEGELIIIYESSRGVWDDEEYRETSEYEIGPKGGRVRSLKGDGEMIADQGEYDFPPELWAGQIFQVRKKEGWLEDGIVEPFWTDDLVKVIGWETIKGPDGKDLEALRIERDSTSLFGELNREKITEWYARGLWVVKTVSTSSWSESTMLLVEVNMPEVEPDQKSGE